MHGYNSPGAHQFISDAQFHFHQPKAKIHSQCQAGEKQRESLKLMVSAGTEISLKIPLSGPAGQKQLNCLWDCPGALCGQLTTLGNPEEQDSTREQPHAGGQNLLPISGLADGCSKAHTWETSVRGKWKLSLFRRPATWGEGRLTAKSHIWRSCWTIKAFKERKGKLSGEKGHGICYLSLYADFLDLLVLR